MQILTHLEALDALKNLDGSVLYLAWKCGLYKALNARAVVVVRQGVGLGELISSIKYGLSFAPELVGFKYTVVEGEDLEEATLLEVLEFSQLGKIIYIVCRK